MYMHGVIFICIDEKGLMCVAKRKDSVGRKAFQLLELPQGILADTSHIEIMGDREATIEGVKGVMEYDSNQVKLNIGKKILRFTGQALSLKCLTDESAIIEGEIASVEFLP